MDNPFYTTSQIARLLNIPLRKVIAYAERGYVEASVAAPSGYGSRRLWSQFDLKRINILLRCEAFGLSPKFLRKLSLLLKEEEVVSWSKLIIDCKGRAFNEARDPADGFPDGDESPYLFICQEQLHGIQP